MRYRVTFSAWPPRKATDATHLSSFCSRVSGFAVEPSDGLVADAPLVAAPPPPRSGLAMRPKLSGEEATAFWASEAVG